MGSFEKFEQYLNDALNHLFDPTYKPPELLWTVTGSNPQQTHRVKAVQAAIIQAIENLKPAADIPPTARIKRLYEVLAYRYLQGLTQDKAAEQLGITPRHLRREQQQATHVLAQQLWEQSHLELPIIDVSSPQETEPTEDTQTNDQPASWRSHRNTIHLLGEKPRGQI